jgi:tRNA nucleotidyltransferase (CCA-adding enzyme)
LSRAIAVARAARERGGRALLVGGFVRDELLGLAPKDADIEVFGIEAPQLREVLGRLGRVDCVGESFRVYKLAWREHGERFELDVSMPRRERKTGAGHKGFEVEGDPHASFEDAARRRDFTVNAIMRDPLSGEILDPFGGRADLESKTLRAVDAAHFGEDSLRVLRAAQFAARFELEIEPATMALCRSIDLSDLPRERVWGEWEKLLLKAARPSLGLRALAGLGVLEQLHPYLLTAMARHRLRMDDTLDRAARERPNLDAPRQTTLMLAALGQFLGWKKQQNHGAERLLDDLNVHSMDGYDVRLNTIRLCFERKRAPDWFRARDHIKDEEFRFLSARIEPRLVYHLARARGDVEAAEWLRERMQVLEVFDGPPPKLLLGRHLLEMGMAPGPEMGKVTQAAWIAQLRGEFADLEGARAWAHPWMENNSR